MSTMSVTVRFKDGTIHVFHSVAADNLKEAEQAVRHYFAVCDPDKVDQIDEVRCGNDCAVR